MIKMIVTDLDGTLLNDDTRTMSNEAKTYLQKLKDKGYIITIVTGRNYNSSLVAIDGTQFVNYIITDTGSYIYDYLQDKELFKSTIDKRLINKLINYYDENYEYIYFCDRNKIYSYSDEIVNNKNIETNKDRNYILNNCKEIYHITISMKNDKALMSIYNKLVKDEVDLNTMIMQDSFSDRQWIMVMPKGCSKYSAIKKLSEYLNINNSEIIAFGDGLNDIDMLQKCGHGVALKNALQPVKKVAKDITDKDNNHDGVINYLKEYLNNL